MGTDQRVGIIQYYLELADGAILFQALSASQLSWDKNKTSFIFSQLTCYSGIKIKPQPVSLLRFGSCLNQRMVGSNGL